MSYGGVIGRPGWSLVGSCLVVDKRWLSVCNMLVVDCSYRSCMVDLLVVVVGSGWGRDDGSLVASVAMADTGERASHSMGCVEEALRADQGGQTGADKQDRLQSIKLNVIYRYFISNTHLMTEHGCPSSNLNRLSNRDRGRSLSFYRRARSTQYSIQNVHEPVAHSI